MRAALPPDWTLYATTAGLFLRKSRQEIIIRTDERRAWTLLSGPFRQGLIDAGVPHATAKLLVPTSLNPFFSDYALPESPRPPSPSSPPRRRRA